MSSTSKEMAFRGKIATDSTGRQEVSAESGLEGHTHDIAGQADGGGDNKKSVQLKTKRSVDEICSDEVGSDQVGSEEGKPPKERQGSLEGDTDLWMTGSPPTSLTNYNQISHREHSLFPGPKLEEIWYDLSEPDDLEPSAEDIEAWKARHRRLYLSHVPQPSTPVPVGKAHLNGNSVITDGLSEAQSESSFVPPETKTTPSADGTDPN